MVVRTVSGYLLAMAGGAGGSVIRRTYAKGGAHTKVL